MEKQDHERTLSYFNTVTRTEEQNRWAEVYIQQQAQRIIQEGDIVGVLKDEMNFIRATFGHKYDLALDEAGDYIRYLQFRHPKKSILTMVNPDNDRWYFEYYFGK